MVFTKHNLKWIINLNIKSLVITYLEEKIGENICYHGVVNS